MSDAGRRRVSAHLLGRDVGGRAHGHARRRHARRIHHVRDAEVGQHGAEGVLGSQRRPQQDVRGLDVTVDDPRLVHDVQRFAQIGREGCRIPRRDRSAGDERRERAAVDVLHDEEREIVIGEAGVEERHERGVTDRREKPLLGLPPAGFRLFGSRGPRRP